jgi:hypothetical protein
MATTKETARDRRALVKESGRGSVSFISVLAGTLVAFGAVALIMAAAGAVGSQLGLSTEGISTSEYRSAGIAGAVAAAVVLFLAFFFGGYTAGRMGRRAGMVHGLLVFVLAAVVMAVVAGLAAALGDPASVTDSISDSGVPTSANTWSDIGMGAGIAALAAMLLGSIFGGIRGDRWHGRLVKDAAQHRAEEHEVRGSATVDRRVGQDPTTVDHRDDDRTTTAVHDELSVEEERERARTSERGSSTR